MSVTLEIVLECTARLDSTFTIQEIRALWGLGQQLGREARMLSKVPFAVTVKDSGKASIVLSKSGMGVVAVEMQDDGRFILCARQCGCSGTIVIVNTDSATAAARRSATMDGRVDLALLCNDKEIAGWASKVRVGGYMAFHGSDMESGKAVAMFRTGAWGKQIGSWDSIGRAGTLEIYRRMA